ncbi:hypothetical protein TR51_16970 [Kitasatospora griseola]|uniref:Uncharacterized protein n=1 Tax=Kitasatospora griseola TaxID=2064 RepID=A0A0D0Q3K5_KITGR|nr:hypothetical protein [Kitasatospora griseola]KIQ65543.1 hypothetical protein TR51_16970 [Kitasatospora griseola]
MTSKPLYIAAAYILVIVGGILSWVGDFVRHPAVPQVVQGLGIFAALYVAAQAIERLVEPFTVLARADDAGRPLHVPLR